MMIFLFLFSFFKKKLHLFLAVLGPRCCTGFSLAAEGRGYSVAVVRRLLTMVSSLAGIMGSRAHELP